MTLCQVFSQLSFAFGGENAIDKRKLNFLQKLCSLEDDFLSKKIFFVRLFSYLIDTDRDNYGFIPDIISILYKYNLHEYLTEFILD